MTDETLDKYQQENLLTLLTWDKDRAKLIRNTVEPHLFEGIYRDIAVASYHYIDRYGEPPAAHLADELSDRLYDAALGEDFRLALDQLEEARGQINAAYTIDRLEQFVRRQQLKVAVLEAAEKLQADGPDALDEAEALLATAGKARLALFKPGLHFKDLGQALAFLDERPDTFPTGIPAFDEVGCAPARGQLHLFVALVSRGKSWYLINLGKRAINRGLKTLHITLEMSERAVAQRYIQAILAIPKRPGEYTKWMHLVDEQGRFESKYAEELDVDLTLSDPRIRSKLVSRLEPLKLALSKLIIKQFPTSQLTISGLVAYLENLEAQEGFVPDLVLLDYLDLLKINTDNYRIALGSISSQLRGLAVERNFALATASQSNREGLQKRTITEGNVAEDYSKIATADTVVTYSQTATEKMFRRARLLAEKVREDSSKFPVFIAQSYETGQFVLQSDRGDDKSYWDMLDKQDTEESAADAPKRARTR